MNTQILIGTEGMTEAYMLPRLLLIQDLMEMFQSSRTGIYRLIASGDLTPIYLDDRPRFDPEDVRRLLDDRRGRRAAGNRPDDDDGPPPMAA